MADIFDVIADGTRRDILHLLRERDAPDEQGVSVSEIVAEIGVSQPTVSKHLKVLREAQLVVVREQGQHRFYSLQAAPLDDVRTWLASFGDAAADADDRAVADDAAAAHDTHATAQLAAGADVAGAGVADADVAPSVADPPTTLPRAALLVADMVGRTAASAAQAWRGLRQKPSGR